MAGTPNGYSAAENARNIARIENYARAIDERLSRRTDDIDDRVTRHGHDIRGIETAQKLDADWRKEMKHALDDIQKQVRWLHAVYIALQIALIAMIFFLR